MFKKLFVLLTVAALFASCQRTLTPHQTGRTAARCKETRRQHQNQNYGVVTENRCGAGQAVTRFGLYPVVGHDSATGPAVSRVSTQGPAAMRTPNAINYRTGDAENATQ